jgi:crotonobetainyl-CoA:carnitine CoA-transferase CaiB-like acyl-CoA transferase
VGVLLALRERDRTGQAQFCTNALLGGAALSASELYVDAQGKLPAFPPLDREQMGLSPGYRMYRVADGWIAVAALGAAELAALQRVAGAGSPGQLEQALAGRKQAELLAELERARVPAEEVRLAQLDAFFDSAEHRRTRLAVSYPHAQMGQMEQVGALWNFGDLELRFDFAPPALGQHTREILAELGWSEREIETLIEQRIVAIDDRFALGPTRGPGGKRQPRS